MRTSERLYSTRWNLPRNVTQLLKSPVSTTQSSRTVSQIAQEPIDYENIVENVIPYRLLSLPGAGGSNSSNKLPLMVKPMNTISLGGKIRPGTDKFVLQQVATEFLQRGGRSIDLSTGYEVDVLEEVLHQTFFNDLNPDEVTIMCPLSFIELRTGQVYNSLPTNSVVVSSAQTGPRTDGAKEQQQQSASVDPARKDASAPPEPYAVFKKPSDPTAAAAASALARRTYYDKFARNPASKAVAEEDLTLSPYHPFAHKKRRAVAAQAAADDAHAAQVSQGESKQKAAPLGGLQALDAAEHEASATGMPFIPPRSQSTPSGQPLFRHQFTSVDPEALPQATNSNRDSAFDRLTASLTRSHDNVNTSPQPEAADEQDADSMTGYEYKPRGRLAGLALSLEEENRRNSARAADSELSRAVDEVEEPSLAPQPTSDSSNQSHVNDILRQLGGLPPRNSGTDSSAPPCVSAGTKAETSEVISSQDVSSSDASNAEAETKRVEHEIKVSVPPIPIIEGGRVEQIPISVAIGADARERTHFKLNEICRNLEAGGVDIVILRDIEAIFNGQTEEETPVALMKDLMLVFVALEEAVRDGKLRFYGVSSSTFGRPEFADMLNLNAIMFLAQTAAYNVAHGRPALKRLPGIDPEQPLSQYKPDPRIPCHLRAVVGSFSIASPGFVTELTCWDASACKAVSTYALARKLGMLVYCDEPLDAVPADDAEIRLQTIEPLSKEYIESMEKSLQAATNECYRLESMYFDLARSTGLSGLPPPIDLCWGQFIATNADKLYNPIRWETFYHRQLAPTLYRALGKLVVVPALDHWAREYRSAITTLCNAFERFVYLSTLKINEDISQWLDEKCPELRSIPTLEGKVMAVTLALGFDSVFVSDLMALRAIADVYREAQVQAKSPKSVQLSQTSSANSEPVEPRDAAADSDNLAQFWGVEASPFKFNASAMRNLSSGGLLQSLANEGLPNAEGVEAMSKSISNIDTPEHPRPASIISKARAIALVKQMTEELTPRLVQRMRDLSAGVLDLSQTKVTKLGYDIHLPPDQQLKAHPK